MSSASETRTAQARLSESTFYTRTLDCVHCGLCLQTCPTYRVLGLEPDSPRGRLYLMRALAEDRIEDPGAIAPHLDRCLDCRACESVCPSGVRYGEILEATRAVLAERVPRRSFAARLRRLALRHVVARQRVLRAAFAAAHLAERIGLRRLARRLGLLRAAHDRLLPPVPPRSERGPIAGTFPAIGEARGEVFLFTGCVMEQLFGRINRATLELLRHNGFTVHVPRAQRCCGALLVHDGQPGPARALARANLRAFAGKAPIVVNSAGCGCALRAYGHLLEGERDAAEFAARVRDVSAFLAEHGLRARPAPDRRKVAYDDPCHLCHGQGVRAEPRRLLGEVPGLTLVAHADPEDCCGSAGIYNLVQPALADEIGRRKAEALLASGCDAVVTGNPGCMLQLRAHLAAKGSAMPVLHTVELLLPAAARAGRD